MKRDENPPVATMSWPDPTFISRVIDALRELGNYKGGRLSSVCHGMFPILSPMNLSGHTGCSIWSETMVGLAMILPISALTEGNLAELAVQLGHMGNFQNKVNSTMFSDQMGHPVTSRIFDCLPPRMQKGATDAELERALRRQHGRELPPPTAFGFPTMRALLTRHGARSHRIAVRGFHK